MEEGSRITSGLGPDPTVLAPALGKRTVLSGFLRHRLGHQTASESRIASVSELNDVS